ncbi:diguanylate cyclase [Planctobacterium marinum]|uniref:diguanylate cyclase n=1 Tax=Planctobacterium marinum TaxID=1631968 RepID=UPI001E4EE938|nr:diguanylate cyclase [Planctobacterium marinum]MCC2606742.1 diguanylate cyclase [Planctobacterium marinum]
MVRLIIQIIYLSLLTALVTGSVNSYARQPIINLTYCVDTDWLPYEGLRDGRHTGMSRNYLDLISAHSGINFSLLKTASWLDSLQLLKSGRCDATPFLNVTPNRSEFLTFSDIIFKAPNVIITHSEGTPIPNLAMIENEKVGVVKGYRQHEYITTRFPDVPIYEVPSELAGIRLLAAGDIDVMVGSMHTILEHIQTNGLHDLRITGWMGLDDELRLGLSKSKSVHLPAINAAIKQITAQQHNEIYRRWNNVKIIREVDFWLMAKIILPIVVLLIILGIRHSIVVRYRDRIQQKNNALESLQSALKKKNDKLHYLSTHDPLTDLFNRVQITIEAEEHIKRKKRGINDCALVFIDIDDFKHLNDHYGHNIGDAVLEQFANILKKCARETDIIGRWGGDEFVVLCPGALKTEAENFAQRLQKELEDTIFSQGVSVSCSIGLSEVLKSDTIDNWLERADNAMYQAKSSGKCCIKAV